MLQSDDGAMLQATLPKLHAAQLFHVGVIADDIDAAMAEMSANLGLSWKGGWPMQQTLWLDGVERTVDMRIAMSVESGPHIELIQAVPDTPWDSSASAGIHHLCYWADNSTAVCAALEQGGARRRMGEPGSKSGYFAMPNGMMVEVIDRALRDHLAAWLARPSSRG